MLVTTAAGVVPQSDWTVLVWIEDGAGGIARGLAESVTDRGAKVRLSEKPDLEAGDEVALRLCLEKGAPTVARRARISSVQPGGNAFECSLEWVASAP